MNRLILWVLLLAVSVNTASAQGQKKTTDGTGHKTSMRFTEKLLKFLGIGDSPSSLKGPGDEVVTGDVWVADLGAKTTHALTTAGGYRSPIFVSSGDILALRGTDVMRIPPAGGEGKRLYSVAGIEKLVGCDSEDPGKVLAVLHGGTGGPRVAMLTVSTGAVSTIPYDASSSQDLQMVESLRGWTRKYGEEELYVESQSKQSFSGAVEWVDVFLRAGNAKAVDVSRCDGTNCGQPSLSGDKRLVAFVKAQDE